VTATGRRAELAGVAALTLGALALFVTAPTYPNYDAYYHLVWGRELLDGVTPTFEAYKAPTQHPLEIAVAAVLGAVLGADADRAFVLIAVLSLVWLAWAVYRLGARVLGPWPGLAAAFFAASSFSLLLLAARGYRDVPFLALVFWAAVRVVEAPAPAAPVPPPLARPPGRDLHVAGLLVLAGLLRPEAWILAGLFALWRRSAWLLAAAAAAPLIWAGVDLAVTGDPLRSLTGTSELAEDLGRERGIAKVPGAFVTFVFDALRPPVAIAAVAGLVAAWRMLGWRRLVVPLALLLSGVVTFVGTGVAGLSILPRYLTVPTVALCLFAGYAVAGFTTLPAGRLRRLWTYGAAVVLAGGLVFAVARLHVVDRLTAELAFIDGTHRDLEAILHTPEVRAGMACGPLTFPNYRLVPDARWMLDLPADRVGSRSARRRPYGAAIFVVGRKALRRHGFADGASPLTNVPDPGFERAVRRGRFVAYVSCP
jgi:hypothetical protein